MNIASWEYLLTEKLLKSAQDHTQDSSSQERQGGFWRRLFGGGKSTAAPAKPNEGANQEAAGMKPGLAGLLRGGQDLQKATQQLAQGETWPGIATGAHGVAQIAGDIPAMFPGAPKAVGDIAHNVRDIAHGVESLANIMPYAQQLGNMPGAKGLLGMIPGGSNISGMLQGAQAFGDLTQNLGQLMGPFANAGPWLQNLGSGMMPNMNPLGTNWLGPAAALPSMGLKSFGDFYGPDSPLAQMPLPQNIEQFAREFMGRYAEGDSNRSTPPGEDASDVGPRPAPIDAETVIAMLRGSRARTNSEQQQRLGPSSDSIFLPLPLRPTYRKTSDEALREIFDILQGKKALNINSGVIYY